MSWTDRWVARAQRKSDERLARWQQRQQERARSGRMTITERWVARAQRKSDERLARWQQTEQARLRQPPPPPWPPGRYLLIAAGGFVVAVAGISVGSAAYAHHVSWLSELMTVLVGPGLGAVIVGPLMAIKAWRASRWNPGDWLAGREDPPRKVQPGPGGRGPRPRR